MTYSQPHKILLITAPLQNFPTGGRAMLSSLLHDCLVQIFASKLVVLELHPSHKRDVISLARKIFGYIDGIDQSVIELVLSKLKDNSYDKVFIDGSNLGWLAAAIKKIYPAIEVCTFFHNCETRFFWGSFKHNRTFRSLCVLWANYQAERRAVLHSDKLVCLSERDSNVLMKLYGRGSTHIFPMAMRDQLPLDYLTTDTYQVEPYALFVGGSFYANYAGISWYARHVAPNLEIKTYVIGKGFELHKTDLEKMGNVKVVGTVESLAAWYLGAQFVVAPIFDGSGMKTKVTEALMYGKKIIGTPEAFSGYEKISKDVGWVCVTADEFVVAIAQAQKEIKLPFDSSLRTLFEDLYSSKAAQKLLKSILLN